MAAASHLTPSPVSFCPARTDLIYKLKLEDVRIKLMQWLETVINSAEGSCGDSPGGKTEWEREDYSLYTMTDTVLKCHFPLYHCTLNSYQCRIKADEKINTFDFKSDIFTFS